MDSRFICGVLIVIIVAFSTGTSHEQISNTTRNELRKYLLSRYGNRYAPPEDQGENYMYVNVALYLRSINTFDEVNGHLQSTTLLILHWSDNRLVWDYSSTKINYVTFSSQEIWVPSLIIENSISDTYLLDPEMSYLIKADPTGWIQMRFPRVLDSKCYANVKFFPFDKHQCNITLGISESLSFPDMVTMSHYKLVGNINILKSNAQWDVKEGNTSEETFLGVKIVNFSVHLTRKSTFIVVTLIVPIIFLCVVNVLVFFIPPGSGDRMSYAITVLLAFSVYMSIVSDKVPASDPMPLYNIFLVFKLTYSALIALCGMVSLRVYEKEGDVNISKGFKKIILCLAHFPCCCRYSKRKKKYKQNKATGGNKKGNGKDIFSGLSVSVYSRHNIGNSRDSSLTEHDSVERMIKSEDITSEVTWKTVSRTIDTVCWIVFSTIIVLEVVLSFVFTIDHWSI